MLDSEVNSGGTGAQSLQFNSAVVQPAGMSAQGIVSAAIAEEAMVTEAVPVHREVSLGVKLAIVASVILVLVTSAAVLIGSSSRRQAKVEAALQQMQDTLNLPAPATVTTVSRGGCPGVLFDSSPCERYTQLKYTTKVAYSGAVEALQDAGWHSVASKFIDSDRSKYRYKTDGLKYVDYCVTTESGSKVQNASSLSIYLRMPEDGGCTVAL